jgi:hypothetical protein
VQLVALCSTRDDALQHVGEPGQWIDIVELGGLNQRGDGGPVMGTTVGSGEESVFPSQGYRAYGALDGVGIQFQPPIVEEQDQPIPVIWVWA